MCHEVNDNEANYEIWITVSECAMKSNNQTRPFVDCHFSQLGKKWSQLHPGHARNMEIGILMYDIYSNAIFVVNDMKWLKI